MRTAVLASLIVLTAAGSAGAGPRERWRHRPGPDPCRFPRLAAVFHAVRTTPATLPRHPVASVALSAGLTAVQAVGSATAQALATGVPQVIRATRLVLLGSPTPGRPLDTALWLASPSLLAARNAVRGWRAVRVGPGGFAGCAVPCWPASPPP